MEPQDNWDEKLEELEDRLLDAMDDPPSFLQKLKKIPRSLRLIGFGAVLALIAVAVIWLLPKEKEPPAPQVDVQAVLINMVEKSDLSTLETIYNGVASVTDAEGEVLYYVAYKAKIYAGIDFSLVEVAVDDSANMMTVTLPPAQINNIQVDAGSLEYIFEDDDTNASGVTSEAYTACQNDVWWESRTEQAITLLASENAETALEALVEPFRRELLPDYTLTVQTAEGGDTK